MNLRLPCPPEHWPAFSRRLDEGMALPAQDRQAWLATLPPPDDRLREWLEPVLSRLGDGPDLPTLEGPRWQADPGDTWRPGETVGPYTLIAPLGLGGMGAVWRARRSDGAFQREVALKLPHPHLLSGAVRDRFARERDILAALEHPHIASFHDAGLTAAGQPYLAMELVEGLPITEHVQRHALALPRRLALIQQVLGAVSHAHARLIAHRDIKPANVLVTAEGQVKLLDFGIAKLLADDAANPALTRESLPYTPRYAAPEQRLGGAATVATDIYALGLLLHEVLVDAPAWPQGVPAAATEPPMPSRCVESAERRRALRGDLDAIVQRALQVAPGARYASAADLADDLDRHLAHRPIAARHITARVRLAKFVRRHRLPAAFASALALSVVAGTAGMAWQTHAAQAQARRAEAVKDFMVSLFQGADPRLSGNAPRGQMPVRALLDRHVDRIDSEFAADPLLRIELLRLAADLYRELGEFDAHRRLDERFVALARQHLDPLHPWILGHRVDGMLRALRDGDPARCRSLAAPLDADLQRAALNQDELRAAWWINMAMCEVDRPEREPQRLEALQQAGDLLARVAPNSRNRVTVLAETANLHTAAGRYDMALQANRQALVLAQSLPQRNEAELQTLHGNIGMTLMQMGRLDDASTAFGAAAAVAEQTVGLNHPSSWVPRVQHLRTLHLAGRRDEAWALLPTLEAALRDEPSAAVDANVVREQIGERLAAEGRGAAALPWLQAAVEGHARARTHDFAHRRALRHLGDALDRAGRTAAAGEALAASLQAYDASGSPSNQAVAAARERWARWLLDRGRLDAAATEFERVVTDAADETWAHVALARAGRARVALAKGEMDRAERESAASLDGWSRLTGFQDVRMQAYLWRVRAAVLERHPSTREQADELWARAEAASRKTDAPESPTVLRPRELQL